MPLKTNQTLGIVGGGQLAKMLVESAHRWSIKTHVYSASHLDPAATSASHHTVGDFKDLRKLKSWISTCDKVTFESEFFDLSKIQSQKFAPSTKNISLLRDRITQKTLLKDFKIPTSDFCKASDLKEFKNPMVLKKRLFGYDGFGTKMALKKEHYRQFLEEENERLHDWMAEDFVPFKRELAFSIARNKENKFSLTPLVETRQKNSKCFWVKGPIEHKKLLKLVKKTEKLLTSIDYVGLIAFELFEDQNNELLVNEVAPRVHNSGHHSINSVPLSQFDLHLMSVMGLDMPKNQKPYLPFAMVNLIGASSAKPKLSLPDKAHFHWYGKSENRAGRKMGHMTCLDVTYEKALSYLLRQLKKQVL